MEMSSTILLVVTIAAMLGCGLVAGVFFAFSTFVMISLAEVPAKSGIIAMQSINVRVVTSWFMVVLLGTAVLCIVLLIQSVTNWGSGAMRYSAIGSALYLVGSVLVTGAFNVPRNNRLANVSPADPNAEERWAGYVSGWTAWNHVRTLASLAAAVSFSVSLVIGIR